MSVSAPGSGALPPRNAAEKQGGFSAALMHGNSYCGLKPLASHIPGINGDHVRAHSKIEACVHLPTSRRRSQ
ncbi:MAG: hypothetical protein JWN42_198 [Candidatus Angelobacter sp.]|nr:hypothetical protein [Candidatus Angelobacter sp.]